MVAFEVPEIDYTRYSNRQLAAVPLAVLALALAVIAVWFATTGAPVGLGIEFTGGSELIVQTSDSPEQIRSTFGAEISSMRTIQAQENTWVVTFQSTETDSLTAQATNAGYDVVSSSGTSATFGQGTQQAALQGVAVAFLGMSVVVFLLFRSVVPSVAVVVSAFSDIVIPVALMNLVGIKLSLGTVAALLMLIGYSVDSDILLNNHILRRSGGFYESAARAMRTGVTMTITSIAAMTVMSIVAYLFGISLLSSIGIVLVFGLSADLMNTYMLNYSLLRWYKFEGIAR